MTTEPQEYVYSDSRGGQPGLTNREYFAAMAMQSLISRNINQTLYPERISNDSVLMADTLITALNQSQP